MLREFHVINQFQMRTRESKTAKILQTSTQLAKNTEVYFVIRVQGWPERFVVGCQRKPGSRSLDSRLSYHPCSSVIE